MKNKLIALFIIIFFTSAIARAEDPPDYEHLISGECVSQNGFFFTENGMVKLVTTAEEKVKLAVLNKQKEVDLLKIDLGTCTKSKKIELQIQKEMYEEQLLVKQKVIDSQKSEMFWKNITSSLSGLALGAILGAGIFYFVTSK